jgi:hypothetical protein
MSRTGSSGAEALAVQDINTETRSDAAKKQTRDGVIEMG